MAWSITIDRAYFTSEAPGDGETYYKKYLNLKGFKISSDSGDTNVGNSIMLLLNGIQVVSQPYTDNLSIGTNSFSNNLPYHSDDYDADEDYLLLGNKFGNNRPGNSNEYDVSLTAGVKSDLKFDLDYLLTENYISSSRNLGGAGLYQGLDKGKSEDAFKSATWTRAGYPNNSATSIYLSYNPSISIGQSATWLMDDTKEDMVKARNSWKLARSLRSMTITLQLNNVDVYLGTDPDTFSGSSSVSSPDYVMYPYSSGDEQVSTSGYGPKMWTNNGVASGDPHITTFSGDRYTL